METNDRTFLERYRCKEWEWGIDGATLSGILIGADAQLLDELLDPTPFEISDYHRDNRSNEKYIYDLINGRVVERMVASWLESQGRRIKFIGSDKDGKIERSKGSRITTQFDLLDIGNGAPRKIEIQMSSQVRDVYHIKDYKGKRIIKQDGEVFFIIEPNNKYFVVSKDDLLTASLHYNPAWRKNCYVIVPAEYHDMGRKKQ